MRTKGRQCSECSLRVKAGDLGELARGQAGERGCLALGSLPLFEFFVGGCEKRKAFHHRNREPAFDEGLD